MMLQLSPLKSTQLMTNVKAEVPKENKRNDVLPKYLLQLPLGSFTQWVFSDALLAALIFTHHIFSMNDRKKRHLQVHSTVPDTFVFANFDVLPKKEVVSSFSGVGKICPVSCVRGDACRATTTVWFWLPFDHICETTMISAEWIECFRHEEFLIFVIVMWCDVVCSFGFQPREESSLLWVTLTTEFAFTFYRRMTRHCLGGDCGVGCDDRADDGDGQDMFCER